MLALAFAGLPAAAGAREAPKVVIAVLPYGTSVEAIADAGDLAPGVVSAGLGSVPIAQTFIDISQGNRVNETVYDESLPRIYLRDGRVPGRIWSRIVERADDAPANVVPGLLAATLKEARIPVAAEANSGLATLIGVDRGGAVRIIDETACGSGCGPGLSVLRARLGELPRILAGVGRDDLVIALAAGARGPQKLLPVGIRGPGFAGNLTSASTRTDGVVTTADLAPTVLEFLGLEVPGEMNGSEVTSGDERDPAAVADLQERLESRPSRETVALLPLGIWIALCALAALAHGRAGARVAFRLLGLSAAIAPLWLLVAAALDASTLASTLMLALGSPLAAFLLDRRASYARALALAAGLTVAAYAIDVVVGSPLTAYSVLGPNPGYGVRFFGIGNELEAILTTLTVVGTGAWLSSRGELAPATRALWFVGLAVLATAAFAPGRFGADVGAAIVLGVGAATAAVVSLGLDRRRAILVVAGGGALALAGLLVVDLILGGAHLSRSVLGAGEAGDVADVFERRLRLMAHTFTDPVYPELLAICGVLLVTGFLRRGVVLSWFRDDAAKAAYLGALAGVLVGTFANDSGSVLLVIGTIYLAILAGYSWATKTTG